MTKQYRPRVSDIELLLGIMESISVNGSTVSSELSGLCGDQRRIARMLRDLVDRGILCAEYRKRPSGRMTMTYFLQPRGELLALTYRLQGELLGGGDPENHEENVRRILEDMRRRLDAMHDGDIRE